MISLITIICKTSVITPANLIINICKSKLIVWKQKRTIIMTNLVSNKIFKMNMKALIKINKEPELNKWEIKFMIIIIAATKEPIQKI